MTDDAWNKLPDEIRRAIRAKFGMVLPEDIDRLDWARCAVGLPFVQRIDFNEAGERRRWRREGG